MEFDEGARSDLLVELLHRGCSHGRRALRSGFGSGRREVGLGRLRRRLVFAPSPEAPSQTPYWHLGCLLRGEEAQCGCLQSDLAALIPKAVSKAPGQPTTAHLPTKATATAASTTTLLGQRRAVQHYSTQRNPPDSGQHQPLFPFPFPPAQRKLPERLPGLYSHAISHVPFPIYYHHFSGPVASNSPSHPARASNP